MNTILIATDFVAALFIIVIIIGLYEVPKEVLKPASMKNWSVSRLRM